MPSHMCAGCDSKQFKAEFSEGQWKREAGRRYCQSCEKILSFDGNRKQCGGECKAWKTEDDFPPKNWRKRLQDELRCRECGDKRLCKGEHGCGKDKLEHEFSPGEWKEAGWTRKKGQARGTCLDCATQHQELKLCHGSCGQRLPEICFTFDGWHKRGDKFLKCMTCRKGQKRKSRQVCGVDERVCNLCGEHKSQTFFSDQQWYHVAEKSKQCIGCSTAPNSASKMGQWTCRAPGCNFTGNKDFFRHWREKQQVDKAKGWEKCNSCFLKLAPLEKNLWTCRAHGCNFKGDKEWFGLWRTKQKVVMFRNPVLVDLQAFPTMESKFETNGSWGGHAE